MQSKGIARSGPTFPVVGIGASAGGLEASKLLLDHIPSNTGMAFIFVQHLDPTHESMMADLLSRHTTMQVRQATDGLSIKPDHLYMIPPGQFLSVSGSVLRLHPQEGSPQGIRMPFNFLLRSLAREMGSRAVAVILSGMGTDGSEGLLEIRDNGGLVLVQDPTEASFDGMPRSAIATGKVNLVAPLSGLAAALIKRSIELLPAKSSPLVTSEELSKIIDLVRRRTGFDFRRYKPGTLERRIEKRLALSSQPTGDITGYLNLLEKDNSELGSLAQDLLINVTDFFRDKEVFELLETDIIPTLIRDIAPDTHLRIWILGCSTGEEAYSLAILFDEAINQSKSGLKLKIFATDIDAEAIAAARNGYYLETSRLTPSRLQKYFTPEGAGYRVKAELRNKIVFSVHDVLTDPPFANLHFISCRNLLIYLGSDAQTRLSDIFHFALRKDGLLLLGQSETLSPEETRLISLSKSIRIYRNLERRPGSSIRMAPALEEKSIDEFPRFARRDPLSRTNQLAELVRREVLKENAPATILINNKRQCLYSLGPTDRYFKIPTGALVNDILSMARNGVSSILLLALKKAMEEGTRVVLSGGHVLVNELESKFTVTVTPTKFENETLFLMSLTQEGDGKSQELRTEEPKKTDIHSLEDELSLTRTELTEALRAIELSNEAQRTMREEALSTHEEYQAANEELIASKEELQSLNEELTALNNQLQETLETQRTISNDLQNVLYSTNVATIFLDRDLNIRLFTPSIQSLFRIRSNDIGRPLIDLSPFFSDPKLFSDSREVLRNESLVQREIEAQTGRWFMRRILPYKTQEGRIEGVVITFIDITENREINEALIIAEDKAHKANIAKTRFLSMASHDLRQPLQTLTIIQELMAKTATTPETIKLLKTFSDTVSSMTGVLNTLLDINKIEAGFIQPKKKSFPIQHLIERLVHEYGLTAQSKNLQLKTVRCSLKVYSDPNLLEQILRNLLSNALNYTQHGKILIGCRRSGHNVRLQVLDTGIGISETDLPFIFEDYYKAEAADQISGKGLGLGLSIVQRLGEVLNHEIAVHSNLGRGSVFSLSVPIATDSDGEEEKNLLTQSQQRRSEASVVSPQNWQILLIEDEPAIRELLEYAMREEGYLTTSAEDRASALKALQQDGKKPDLILTDYTLPGGKTGLQIIEEIWEILGRKVPAIVLTGDISTDIIKKIEQHSISYFAKPVRLSLLSTVIKRLLNTQALHS